MSVGIVVFLTGLVPWTIGGMISFVTRYDVHNRHIRASLDPVRPSDREGVTTKEYLDALFNNPKSKWWCRVGFGICAVGMAMIWVGV
jgi:hypothetical protein